MRERPIGLYGPEVQAVLAGTKTQTRRVVNPQPVADANWVGGGYLERTIRQPTITRLRMLDMTEFCPYGQPGDRLWVRESWSIDPCPGENYRGGPRSPNGGEVMYRATDGWNGPWTPSSHMPRWASRITLEITEVRVERLQDISEDEARDEGAQSWAAETVIDGNKYPSCKAAFIELWRSINGPGSWAENPWVWVIAFRRVAPLAGV